MGHLNIALDNYEVAINLYKKAIEKLPSAHGDVESELYLAKAYFKAKMFDQS